MRVLAVRSVRVTLLCVVGLSVATATSGGAAGQVRAFGLGGLSSQVGQVSQVGHASYFGQVSQRTGTTTIASSAAPVRVEVDGPEVEVNTAAEQAFVFDGRAGQSVAIDANRSFSVRDPLDGEVDSDRLNVFELTDSGRYVVVANEGLNAPTTFRVSTVPSKPVVYQSVVGETVSFDTTLLSQQYARIALRGGQRYQASVVSANAGASFCISADRSLEPLVPCFASSRGEPTKVTFVLDADQTVLVWMRLLGEQKTGRSDSTTLAIEPVANDVVATTTTSSVVELDASIPQAVVVPAWGSPAERVVLSSPNRDNVAPWGDPWIDTEETGGSRVKVFAVPTVFTSEKPPFVTWRGTSLRANRQRVGVFRGEDTAVALPADAKPVSIRNQPWFASVASMNLEGGVRYAIHIVGRDLRPLNAVIREPNG